MARQEVEELAKHITNLILALRSAGYIEIRDENLLYHEVERFIESLESIKIEEGHLDLRLYFIIITLMLSVDESLPFLLRILAGIYELKATVKGGE